VGLHKVDVDFCGGLRTNYVSLKVIFFISPQTRDESVYDLTM